MLQIARERRARFALGVGILFLACATLNLAQDAKKPAAKPAEKPAAKKKTIRGRLPAYYGQIGLSKEQREKIYQIQANYRAKIEELEKQLAELRAKQQAEIDAVLTPDQKKRLEELRSRARSRRSATKSSNTAEKRSGGQ